MQSRAFEEFRAVGGIHANVEGNTVSIERQRHFHDGLPKHPDLSIHAGKRGDPITIDRHDDVTRFDLRARGWSFGSDADAYKLVFDLAVINPEPRPHQSIEASEFCEV